MKRKLNWANRNRSICIMDFHLMTHSDCFLVALWRDSTTKCASNIPSVCEHKVYFYITMMILADVFSAIVSPILSDSSR